MNILVNSFSHEAASKTKGLVLKNILEENIEHLDSITVDFSNVNRFASPFFNNSFAALALKYGFKTIEKIKLINISSIGLETYDTSMENASMISENPEFTDEVTKIVQIAPKSTEE